MTKGHRDRQGRFRAGNPGGPGRPRRAIEREYLATLSDAVPLEAWREIVKAAIEAAKQGDAKARDWLSRYLIGDKAPSLTDLAADEAAQVDAERDILERLVKRRKARAFIDTFDGDEIEWARKQLRDVEDSEDERFGS